MLAPSKSRPSHWPGRLSMQVMAVSVIPGASENKPEQHTFGQISIVYEKRIATQGISRLMEFVSAPHVIQFNLFQCLHCQSIAIF